MMVILGFVAPHVISAIMMGLIGVAKKGGAIALSLPGVLRPHKERDNSISYKLPNIDHLETIKTITPKLRVRILYKIFVNFLDSLRALLCLRQSPLKVILQSTLFKESMVTISLSL